MKIALFQHGMCDNVNENTAKVLKAMKQAAEKGASLIFFPEIHFSPFFPQHPGQDVSEYLFTREHEAVQQVQAACRQYGIAASPNIYLQEAGKTYDASLMIDRKGTILGISKMVHVPQMPNFFEQDYYTPSDSGFHVYALEEGKVGIVICYDRHLPESVRTCALQGAEVVIIPTANAKGEPMDMFAWEMRVQAMHNGAYIAMCNRVGQEDEMEFAGESLVIDPHGNLIAKADDQEQLLVVELDLETVDEARQERPYLALRRPEMYWRTR